MKAAKVKSSEIIAQGRGHCHSGSKSDTSGPRCYPDHREEVAHIFGGSAFYNSNKHYKVASHEVLSITLPCKSALKWSDSTITSNQNNSLDNCAHSAQYPIVAFPIISNALVNQVLVDRGSFLSILYIKVLDAM